MECFLASIQPQYYAYLQSGEGYWFTKAFKKTHARYLTLFWYVSSPVMEVQGVSFTDLPSHGRSADIISRVNGPFSTAYEQAIRNYFGDADQKGTVIPLKQTRHFSQPIGLGDIRDHLRDERWNPGQTHKQVPLQLYDLLIQRNPEVGELFSEQHVDLRSVIEFQQLGYNLTKFRV